MNGQLLDGRYEIVQVLGGGAFGRTFLAQDLKRPGHPQCVVKQLSYSSIDTEALNAARRLFKNEAEILEKLGQHDQIPTLLAEFEYNSEFYLVQQYIDGHPLNQEIQRNVRWTEEQVLNLLLEVLPILAFVHGKGVIHRDIKPANLMRRATDNKLVLIDFGAVKLIGSQLPQGQATPTVAIGTPAYMPMEQFHGFPQYNSDIYALGMIAIQALLGLPANELTKLRENDSVNTGEVAWRKQTNISPALADVIDKMVLFDWRKRYQSADEVLSDLGQWTGNYGDFSAAETRIRNNTQTRKFSLNAKSSMLLGVAALAVVGGLGFVVYNQLPQTKAVALYQQGMEKKQKQDPSGAIEDFTQAIQIYPQYAQAYYERANTHFFTGNYQRSEEDATKAIELKNNYVEAYTRRCAARVLLRKPQEAEEDCTQAIKINPNDADAYLNRIGARINLNNKEGALADSTKLIDLNPNDPQAYNNRGTVYNKHIKDYNKAIADYNQALRLASKKPQIAAEAYNGRGYALVAQSKPQAAIEDFKQAIALKKDFAEAYIGRGVAYVELGNIQEAIEDLNKADTLCSQQGKDCSQLAQFYLQQIQQQQ